MAAEDQPLELSTPVPTPQGWSTVGELAVGDEVFDSAGSPVRVARSTPVLLGEECFRVTFSDGESVVASGSHGWTIERLNGHGDRYEAVTVSTSEMAATTRDRARTQAVSDRRIAILASGG